jgi:hypothetical protein
VEFKSKEECEREVRRKKWWQNKKRCGEEILLEKNSWKVFEEEGTCCIPL